MNIKINRGDHDDLMRLTEDSVFAILGPRLSLDSGIWQNGLMEQEEKKNQEGSTAANSFSFLSSIRKGQDITVRDDLLDFQLLLDAVKLSRRKGIPFRIVDSGSRDVIQLEWLAAEGAIIYTSDDAERELDTLQQINKACKRGNSFLACLQNGPLKLDSESAAGEWEDLMALGAEGTYIFLSNRENKRDVTQLGILADQCLRGGSWLVYYHHGELEAALVELARNGAWIHVGDSCLKGADEHSLLLEVIRAAHSAGTNCVFHLERELEYYPLKDIQKAGAIMLFKSKLIDYRSPLKSLQEQASHPKLDARAYYLYSTFFF
jgi:hypothetical protein